MSLFEGIGPSYNLAGRRPDIGDLSSINYQALHTATSAAA